MSLVVSDHYSLDRTSEVLVIDMRRKGNLLGPTRPYIKPPNSFSPVTSKRPSPSNLTSLDYIDALITARKQVSFPAPVLPPPPRQPQHMNLRSMLEDRMRREEGRRNRSTLLEGVFHGSERIDERSEVLRPSRMWERRRLQAHHRRHASAATPAVPNKESILRGQFQASRSKVNSLWSQLEADFQDMQ